ncbi:MAG: MFS transporter [Chloroflexota bacterium]
MPETTVNPAHQKRIFATLFATQAIYRATVIAGFTLTPVIAASLGGSDATVGYPNTASLIGQAAFAYPVGLMMDRWGRRSGLSIGYTVGILGGLISIVAIVSSSFWLFLLGAIFLGMMRGSSEQGRYVAAEVFPESQRPRIIGWIVFCGTAGAIFGPLLVDPSTQWAGALNLPEHAGPFLLVVLLMITTTVLTMWLLRPDPLLISQQLNPTSSKRDDHTPDKPKRPLRDIFDGPLIRLGVVSMVIGQVVMVLLMVVTPLHMDHHHHTTKAISWVIMAHTLGMFGLSALTGRLVERLGRIKTILIGLAILFISCFMAPVSTDVPILATALFLLGLGWNMCYVAGSTLLAENVEPIDRGRAQGAGEVMVSLASGVGTLGVGSVFASGGIIALSQICIVLCIILTIFTWYSVRKNRTTTVPI